MQSRLEIKSESILNRVKRSIIGLNYQSLIVLNNVTSKRGFY